jgi:carbamoyl-phosphate synthase large subunit
MPRRDDLRRILILGSGPIVIGQAAEFDYSGVQACKVLREEGYEVILVNSNPATIMTDPEFADATYVEPLLPGPVAEVIERERPDALLPTLGGQTALNLAKALAEDGTLERFGVELIGRNYDAITTAEDRDLFREAMEAAGLEMPASAIATTLDEVDAAASASGCRASCARRTRSAGAAAASPLARGAAHDRRARHGRLPDRPGAARPVRARLGGVRARGHARPRDNVVIVCSIENLDPMGVHTGDSVTVAPQQTLSDHLYQRLRDQAMQVIRAVGVETGGSNVQFAVHPETERILVIEMNPRVSRSSALASKATGFPSRRSPPAWRWATRWRRSRTTSRAARRPPRSSRRSTTSWSSGRASPSRSSRRLHRALHAHEERGEAMAFGRTFGQAFAKAMRSRELDAVPRLDGLDLPTLLASLERPASDRFDVLLEAFRRGRSVQDVHARTLDRPVVPARARGPRPTTPTRPFAGERSYRAVDTCAAEFEAATPYFYSAWERTASPRWSARTARASSSSARAPTASARASSSTTAACTRR